ncbi:MBL fold metallo-hydrolase [Aurantiacibacter gilvus]|uniref:MBL fold metallo-hydrolase n=1 Tax=Aurantiacibacter gilvus TaxID=3139141 RepID=A0ABU9IDI9_9SPHN
MSGKSVAALAALALVACTGPQLPAAAQDHDAQMRADWAETCEDWDDWDKPAPLFRVFANTWHVGTCGISVILIAGDGEFVLIDSGTEAGAQVVLDNLRALAIDPVDIALLLHSHEHFDHVGGLHVIADLIGGEVVTSFPAEEVISTGVAAPDDPQVGMHEPMVPVNVQRRVADGDRVQTDSLELLAIATPGHTPGALTWHWDSCDDEQCLTIAYADSLSPVSRDDYRFSDHPEYVQAYREGIARLAALDCDVLLTPHPSASGMRDKLVAGDLTGGMDCAAYAADRLAALEARLAQEADQ